MTKEGFWRTGRFPRLAIALLLLKTSRSTFTQSLYRGIYETGLRINERMAARFIDSPRIEGQSIAAVGCWPSLSFMCMDSIPRLVRSSAHALDKVAGVFGPLHDFCASGERGSLVGLCHGVVTQRYANRAGFDTVHAKRGECDAVGRFM